MNRLESRNWILLPYLLILGAAPLRLAVSHPYNFIPILSCVLFFGIGAHQSKPKLALQLFGQMGVISELTFGLLISSIGRDGGTLRPVRRMQGARP